MRKSILYILIILIAGMIGVAASAFGVIGIIMPIAFILTPIILINPFVGLCALIFYLPYNTIISASSSVFLGDYSLAGFFKEIILVLIIIGSLIKISARDKNINKYIHSLKSTIYLPIYLFIIWNCFIYFYSVFINHVGPFVALVDARSDIEWIMLAFIIPLYVCKKNRLKVLLNIIIISALIFILIGVFMSAFGLGVHERGGITRFISIWGESSTNVLAVYTVFIFIISIILSQMKMFRGQKIYSYCVSMLSIVALFLTQSRRGLLALLFGVIILFTLNRKSKLLFIYFFMIAIIFIIMSPIIMPRIHWTLGGLPRQETLVSILMGEEVDPYASVGGYKIEPRIFELTTAVGMIAENPLFGLGYGKIGYEAGRAGGEGAKVLHNYYISLWLRTGIVGLFLYLWIIFKVIKSSRNIMDSAHNEELIKMASIIYAISLIFLLINMFGGTVSLYIGYIIWALIGILVSIKENKTLLKNE